MLHALADRETDPAALATLAVPRLRATPRARPAVSEEAKKVRARKMIRELRTLGYHVERLPAPPSSPA
jgi:hypothetical protein